MQIIIIYLIKAAIFQVLLFTCYWLLLRRDTFYKMNRYYFMVGLILSLLIPAINFDINSWFNYKESPKTAVVYEYIPNLSFDQMKEPWWHQFVLSDYLLMILIVGAFIMLVRLLVQYISLKKISSARKAEFDSYNIKFLDKPINPFSFGKTIYLNPVLHSEKELEEIIEHELVHILQKHSIDIIAASVNKSLFWWNPAAWLLNKAVRDNLEYIADRIILEKGFDRKHYQYHLLQISQLAYSNSIAHHFNFSNLKKRIVMMNKKESKSYQKIKWLLLAPVAGILLLSFNYRNSIEYQIKTITGLVNDTIPAAPPPPPPPPPPISVNSKGYFVDIRNYGGTYMVVVENKKQEPVARIPLTKWQADEKNYTAKYGEIPALPRAARAPRPPAPPAPVVLPAGVASISIHHDNDISADKNSHDNKATVTLKNGQKEYYDLDIPNEREAYEKKYGALPPPPPPPPPGAAPVSAITIPDNVLVIIDGKEATVADVKVIPATSIKTVTVLKDENAVREFGEKGKNGVIKIVTKVDVNVEVKPELREVVVVGYQPKPIPDNVLYIIDDVETTADAVKKIKPEDILTVNVMKDETSTKAYGDKGKNGVIIIRTKNATIKPESVKQ